MNTNTTTKIIAATTITICLGTAWASPVHATTNHHGQTIAVRTEPDPGQLIGQRKARAAHDFVAYAAARARYAALARPAVEPKDDRHRNDPPRPCTKFPDLCGITPTQ